MKGRAPTTKERLEYVIADAEKQEARAEKAERERDDALELVGAENARKHEAERDEARGAADEALEIAQKANVIADAAVTRAEARQATIARVRALLAEKTRPDQYVFVEDLWAVLKEDAKG